jgi:hypothetical protein
MNVLDLKKKTAVASFPGSLRKFAFRTVEFAIETELPDTIIVERLRAIVEPRNAIIAPLVPTEKLFAGKVSAQGFEIMRIIGYGDGNLPVIIGYFEPGPKGARVCVTIHLTKASSFFRMFTSFVFVIVLLAGSIAIGERIGTAAGSLLFVASLVVAWGTMTRESSEERKARTLLEETLQTTPSPRIQKILSGTAPRRLPGVVFILGLGLILYGLISRIVTAVFVNH